MKFKALLSVALLSATMAYGQADPTIMTINGQPVSRSEFEYSYNKNNTDGVIDRKSVDEYVPLFVNYKLKVQAALDAHLDTLPAFRKEFLGYRNQQIRPAFITDADVEDEARKIYRDTKQQIDANGGLWHCAHILIGMGQHTSKEEEAAARQLADSIYTALQRGADFANLAKRYSTDTSSAKNGGDLPRLQKGQTVAEFEKAMLTLKPGETSRPVLSPFGYHIIRMIGHESLPPYDSLRADIMQYIEMRGLRDQIINQRLDSLVQAGGKDITQEQILDRKLAELEEKDADLKHLIREYHDGLLMVEMSNRTVWDKVAKDETALEAYFRKHRKQYKWAEPRFKGIAYHVKKKADVDAVKECVKGLPFSKWAERLRNTFNKDGNIRIRVEKGIFRKGDNALIDREVFGQKATVAPVEGYPIDAVFGKKIKAPEELDDVRDLVISNCQEELEKSWVAALRRKYKVVIDKAVLSTVNRH
ncbi:MAG: peptidylprolyl isomerase [Prevotella denticola]